MKIYQKLIFLTISAVLSFITEMKVFPAQAATFSVSGTGQNDFSFNGTFDYNASNSEITGGAITYSDKYPDNNVVVSTTLNIYRTSVKDPLFPSVLIIGLLYSDVDPASPQFPAKYDVQRYFDFNLPTDVNSFLTGGGGSCLSSVCGDTFERSVSSEGPPITISSYQIAGPKLGAAAVPEPSTVGDTFFLAFLGLGWLLNKKISS